MIPDQNRKLSHILECPFDCSPGHCVRTGTEQYPYLCSCAGTFHLDNCDEESPKFFLF
jgi:hypothetical protein